MYVRIIFSIGFGYEEEEVLKIKDLKEVEDYAEERLVYYSQEYEYLNSDWLFEDEREDCFGICTYEIEEITKKEYFEEK